MTDLVESLRDSFRARAEHLDAVGLAPAPLIASVGRRRRRQRITRRAAGLACLLALTLTVGYVLQSRTLASRPATHERVPSGVPLSAVQSPVTRAALWASCSDPGQGACHYTAAATNGDWDKSTLLAFSSNMEPRLVVLRSGGVAVLASGDRGWILAGAAEAEPLTFSSTPIDPSSTVSVTAAPPGTPPNTKYGLSQKDIEAGKDTNTPIWAIDEATRTVATLSMQPGSPARLAAEPVRAGTVAYAALSFPQGITIDVMTFYDDGRTHHKSLVNVGYLSGKPPRWPTALAVGSDQTIAVVLSAPAAGDEVWVLRGSGRGTWTQLGGLPFRDVANLAVTDDGSIVVLDAASGQTSVYDPLNRMTPAADSPRLLTLSSNSGLLVGVTQAGEVASSRDGRTWDVVRPRGSGR